MTDYTHDIERYLNGTMTPQERHAFEKKVLADPFLAEALEGAEQVSTAEFKEDVESLNKEIRDVGTHIHQVSATARYRSASKAKHASPAQAESIAKEKTRHTSGWAWSLRIAAGLVLVLVSGYLIWQATQPINTKESLALDSIPEPSVPASTDSINKYKYDDTNHIAIETIKGNEETDYADVASTSRAKQSKSVAGERNEQANDELLKGQAPATQPLMAETRPVEVAPTADIKAVEIATLEKTEAEKAKLADAAQREATENAKKQIVSRAASAAKVIHGKVTSSEDGTALPGVNVMVKGTTIGAITGVDGSYQLTTETANPVLVYSFIGLQTQEVNAGNLSEVDVALSLDASQLSEVVVVGYGTQRIGAYTPTVNLAQPENGNRAFRQYLEKNIVYPDEAKAKKIEGRVTVEFFVEPDGSLTDFSVIRGIGGGCDEELIRLIKDGPRWVPTKRDNIPVRDKARVRLKFELPK